MQVLFMGNDGTCFRTNFILYVVSKMITYDFRCNKCKNKFIFQLTKSLKAIEELGYDIEPECPRCESKNVTKIINPIPVIFRGDGFTKSNIEKGK